MCDVSERDREASVIRKPWSTRGCCAMEKRKTMMFTRFLPIISNHTYSSASKDHFFVCACQPIILQHTVLKFYANKVMMNRDASNVKRLLTDMLIGNL